MPADAIFADMDNGRVILPGKECSAADLPWKPHPAFKGVYLKHLVTAKDTEGRFSAHLVKVDPEREIGEHRHEGTLELHEVVQGQGVCHTRGLELDYRPGVVSLMPASEPHRILAGPEGLCLLAKFAPALL
jgi:quercetin dioxygenase-like cupin family protein